MPISTHAPARGATGIAGITSSEKIFQPTLPRGERLIAGNYCAIRMDFNPRSREGSDNNIDTLRAYCDISTHAPARGATVRRKFNFNIQSISTHAPARGATTVPPELTRLIVISTHAPARGATLLAISSTHPSPHFNPRSREGSDQEIIHLFTNTLISTHAPARGATYSVQ